MTNKIVLLSYLFRTATVLSALCMAMNGIKGWGYFLLVALLTGVSYESKKGE